MARIAGVNIPTNKRVIVALTYIHGIGPKSAVDIADKLGIEVFSTDLGTVQRIGDQKVIGEFPVR